LTIVAEIPLAACAGSSRLLDAIAQSRAKFDAKFRATPRLRRVRAPVRLTGVVFLDFVHGQTGVAPNGVELHPLLDIEFLD